MSSVTKRELREAAAGLGRILEAVERGELDAPPAMLARLDGARLALEALSETARPRPAPGPIATD